MSASVGEQVGKIEDSYSGHSNMNSDNYYHAYFIFIFFLTSRKFINIWLRHFFYFNNLTENMITLIAEKRAVIFV